MESILIIALICISTIIVGGIAFVILRRIGAILDLQQKAFKLSEREQQVHSQENSVLLNMLNAELRANRSKLEAYTIIYQETLTDLKNTQKEPQYRKLGDLIQMQPSLRNDVYKKNTHRLDGLGAGLAEKIVEFYTQFPDEVEYRDIEPDADSYDVANLVDSVLTNAKTIAETLDQLIQDIEKRPEHFEISDEAA